MKDNSNEKLCTRTKCTGTQHQKKDGSCVADAKACGDYFRGADVDVRGVTMKRCL